MKRYSTLVDAVDMSHNPTKLAQSAVSSAFLPSSSRCKSSTTHVLECSSHIHPVESALRHGKSLCVFPTRRLHNMMCSRPPAMRKYFFSKKVHTRKLGSHEDKRPLVMGDTRVSLMWWAVCFARVESGVDHAHGMNECAAGGLSGHSAIAFIGVVSRAVAGKCVCHGQRLFYMCTCGAGPIYRITVAWSARRQSSLHTRYSCMCRSRAPIRAALRFVEIANKAICDRNSPAVLREQAQFGAQWFVMSVHSPQQTIGAPRAVVLSQPKIPDERSGRGENACVPFVDVGSLLAMGRVSRASTRHDVSCPALLRQMRAPCAHSTHVTYRWSWLAHLRAGQCCYIDRCFGRAGQPWVRRDTALSTSAASRPSVWPAWTVCCSLCLSAPGAARIRTACFEDDDESPQATPHGILRRLWPPNVITAASVRVPISARNRHTILHNAQQTCSRCISAGRNPVVAASQSRSTCAPPLCTPGPTAH